MLALAWLLGFWILGTAICGFVYQERAFKPSIPLLRRAEWMGCASTRPDPLNTASLRPSQLL